MRTKIIYMQPTDMVRLEMKSAVADVYWHEDITKDEAESLAATLLSAVNETGQKRENEV
jgi:hypothetical protein